ncbi:hypothetical protein HID58_013516, partial [Brassica napus]
EREWPKEEGEISVTERRQRNLHKVESIGVKAASVGTIGIATDMEREAGDSAEMENLVNGLEQSMDLMGTGKVVSDSDSLEVLGGNGEQDNQAGEVEKKKGAHKGLFKKPLGISVGSSKMRLVQAVLSPRKNGASKSTRRQGGGEGAKQTEEKGPSHPNNSKKPDA